MSALIASILATWGPWIIGGIVAVGSVAGAYLKGKSVQKQKSALEDVTNANKIRKDGAVARADADTSQLHDDGYKRD